ncbi:MAG TPA: sigma-54 dependent transcriptional regulator, partial [Candidatus Brocadiales bacterium]|nr:sigma-54 dependent transcriptional regulator [Candidatus Brocadiales bacterium]
GVREQGIEKEGTRQKSFFLAISYQQMSTPRILVVDDDKNSLSGLVRLLEREGYEASGAISAYEALALLDNQRFDIVLTDMKLPGMGGLSLLEEIKKRDELLPILVMTAYGSVENAVSAVKKGAEHYLTKPLDLEELKVAIDKVWHQRKRLQEAEELKGRLEAEPGVSELVGNTPEMQRVLNTIRDVASSTATVLIHGETGVGKELVARAIHSYSPRKNKPFVVLHCAALADGVLESELFGHEKGSFTGALYTRRGRFELAHGGTLFLDEVSEMGTNVQVKLLRVTETGTFERVGGEETRQVDVRLVAATNKDLESQVSAGKFREDLYYRLNVIKLDIPPLRERKADVPVLANYFLLKYAGKNHKKLRGFSPEAMQLLQGYHWPGNVRELENMVERAVVFCKKNVVEPEYLSPNLVEKGKTPEFIQIRLGMPMKDVERDIILKTLELTHGNKAEAARILGLSSRTIDNKLKEWAPHGPIPL